MIYSIQRDEGAQALENHLNVIDSKKSLRIEYLAKQLKSCDAKPKGLRQYAMSAGCNKKMRIG